MNSFFVKNITVLSIVSSAFAFAGNTDGYNIKIKVKGLKEGSTCMLANYYGEKQYIKDSAKVNAKGQVIFQGKEKMPQGIYLFVPANRKYFDFVMDEKQNFSLETDTTDYVKNMKVKGSDENKYFYEYQQFMSVQQKQIEPLRQQYRLSKSNADSAKLLLKQMGVIDEDVKNYKLGFIKKYPTTFVAKLFKAMEEPEVPEAPMLPNGRKDSTFAFRYYKAHYFDNMDFTDDRMLRTPIFHAHIKQYLDRMTAQIPDSINLEADYLIEKARPNPEMFKYMVWWITLTYESSKIMGMDAVFVHMVEKYYVTKQATWLDSTQYAKITERAATLKPVLIGKYAPSINMVDTSGNRISLYDVKAKYTVVIFWDHGCGHCKKEVPKLSEIYKTKLKQKGVEVYAIETENKPDDWKKFIREHKLEWINVNEPDDYNRAVTKKFYDIYSTPVIYLLDENKIIIGKRIEAEQLIDLVEMNDKIKEKPPTPKGEK
jgi:peroxiredoxin